MDLEFDWAWKQVCALKKQGVVWRPIGLPPMETEAEGATSSGAPGAPGAPGGTIVEDEDEEDEGPVGIVSRQLIRMLPGGGAALGPVEYLE